MRYSYTQNKIPAAWCSDPTLSTLDPLILQIMANRGFQDTEQVKEFLFPKETGIFTTDSIKNMGLLLAELTDAIQNHRQIVIYHDYDVDGCCACAIMLENLRRFGAKVDIYSNDRNIDGFGLCRNGVDRLLEDHPDTEVILTVDNGISAVDGVRYARKNGLSVLITDHHEPGAELPDANVIVNCKQRDETYLFREFCGAGLALKVMLALAVHLHHDPQIVFNSVDLAAFATIADVVPLLGENRAIVKAGIRMINNQHRTFFQSMCETKGPVEFSKDISFNYAPVVNAVSRMGYDASDVVKAMVSQDRAFTDEKIRWMNQLNEQRKELSAQQVNLSKHLHCLSQFHQPKS